MIQSRRPFHRALLILASASLLFVVGCKKPPKAAPAAPPPPPPPAAKPSVTISADPSSIDKGQSAKLTWTTTDASNVSIAPEVGAVTLQGSTTVTPADSTTYTITASGPGGSTDGTARVSVNVPAPPPQPVKNDSFNDLFTQEVKDAYFDLDKADIRADAQQALRNDADFLKKYPQAHITIEGHCDERGSTEYNLALGDRRANAVKQYLVNLGIPAANINTVSYGKEKPFCMESSESCWQQNRRGHLTPAQ
jgi:peptidoglycan-associated lipoprotein